MEGSGLLKLLVDTLLSVISCLLHIHVHVLMIIISVSQRIIA